MSVTELLQSAEYVVDAPGHRKAVVVGYAAWEELLMLLEDIVDADEVRRLRKSGEEAMPWSRAQAELRAGGVDV